VAYTYNIQHSDNHGIAINLKVAGIHVADLETTVHDTSIGVVLEFGVVAGRESQSGGERIGVVEGGLRVVAVLGVADLQVVPGAGGMSFDIEQRLVEGDLSGVNWLVVEGAALIVAVNVGVVILNAVAVVGDFHMAVGVGGDFPSTVLSSHAGAVVNVVVCINLGKGRRALVVVANIGPEIAEVVASGGDINVRSPRVVDLVVGGGVSRVFVVV